MGKERKKLDKVMQVIVASISVAVHIWLFNATATASQETEHVKIRIIYLLIFLPVSLFTKLTAAYAHGTRSVNICRRVTDTHAALMTSPHYVLRTQTRLTQVKFKPTP